MKKEDKIERTQYDLWAEWCTEKPRSTFNLPNKRVDMANLLVMESPAEFIDAFLKFSKSILSMSVIPPSSIEKIIEILVCNKVHVHNDFILASLIDLLHHPSVIYDRKQELGVFLEKRHCLGLAHESEEYWTVKLLADLLGRDSYPWIINLARSNKKTEVRACAIKSLAMASGQHFDRGLPKSPDKWRLQDLRMEEVEAWIAQGCPDGTGYPPPALDSALTAPVSDFEKIVFALNNKLKKEQDTSDYSSYDNYLILGSKDRIERLKKLYALPENYLDFLTRFSPCHVYIVKGMYEIHLYGADDLEKLQIGYSIDVEGNALTDWPHGFLVIADRFADPYCIDTTGKKKGVLFASHGQGAWKFSKKHDSLEDFLLYLSE